MYMKNMIELTRQPQNVTSPKTSVTNLMAYRRRMLINASLAFVSFDILNASVFLWKSKLSKPIFQETKDVLKVGCIIKIFQRYHFS